MQLSLPIGVENPLRSIRDRLLVVHGPQRDELRHDPVSQFVKAMLGSRTRDATSQAAFTRLQAFCPSWEVLPDLDASTVFPIIHDVTDAPIKAVRLVMAAQDIRRIRGRLELDFLSQWPVEYAMAWFLKLRGIDVKTAAVILNFSTLRKRAFVVDRHVLRVAWRLDLLPEKTDFGRAYGPLMRILPDDWDADDLYELHWLLKMHGQTRCNLERQICGGCPLIQHCSARRRTLKPPV